MCSQLRHIQPQPDDSCDNTRRETVKALGCRDEAIYVCSHFRGSELSQNFAIEVYTPDPGLPVCSIFPFTKMHVRNNLITSVAQQNTGKHTVQFQKP